MGSRSIGSLEQLHLDCHYEVPDRAESPGCPRILLSLLFRLLPVPPAGRHLALHLHPPRQPDWPGGGPAPTLHWSCLLSLLLPSPASPTRPASTSHHSLAVRRSTTRSK